MNFTMVVQILYTSILEISLQETIEYTDHSDAAASLLEFLWLLFLAFLIVILILIGVMIFRNRKLRRLTNPHKDYYR